MQGRYTDRFQISKTGVKVYLRPAYHPALKGTFLSHPDFIRKSRELFSKRSGNVKGLPKICSKNSEDAQTWRHFSPLLHMSHQKRIDWLMAFLKESFKREVKRQDLIGARQKVELMFWRGKRAKPIYSPPAKLGYPEGDTEVDLTILTEKTITFVEAKYCSEISTHTTHCPNRDQIIRNIDVGTHYAWNKGLNFYFILLTSSNCNKSRRLLSHYVSSPQEIISRLPHRTDIPKRVDQITKNLGLITWDKICDEVM